MKSLHSYIVGYSLSLFLTVLAFGALLWHEHTSHAFPTHNALTAGFILLSLAQLFVQLYFFLHIGRGKDKKSNAVAFLIALFVVAVLVGGTLWIMSNLSHRSLQTSPFINNQITAQNEND